MFFLFVVKKFLKNRVSFGGGCRRLVFSWMTAVFAEYVRLPVGQRDLSSLDGLNQMSFFRVVIVTAGIFTVLCLTGIIVRTEKLERGGIFMVFVCLAVLALSSSLGLSFFIACAVLLVFFCFYVIGDGAKLKKLVRRKSFPVACTAGVTAVFFIFISAWTVCRVRTFCAPTYDFGIFSQMFYNMRESGFPLTTLERDGLLSHFAVHVSPIYYLFLPVYFFFSYPETLQILQAGVMASSVIPLWKLCRARGLSERVSALVCGILVFLPAFGGGAGYDLHENCFLTPLILWSFWGIEKKKYALSLIFVLLTLCVKEDAAVYTCVIGLWLCAKALLDSDRDGKWRDVAFGAAVIVVSVGWFAAVTAYLSSKGDGVMTYRYSNFMYDGSDSLLTVVKAVIMNPMKAVYECVDSEKIKYIGFTMLPLAGIPLYTRRYERYILLIPYLLINLMSDYTYQHDIFFQYSFGSTAFLVYLTVVNLADISSVKRQIIVSAAALIIGAGCFFSVVVPNACRYLSAATENREYYREIRACLDAVPENVSVASTTFYTVPLSSREVLWDVSYCSREHLLESEYVVVNPSDKNAMKKHVTGDENEIFAAFEKLLKEHGFERICFSEGRIAVYAKASNTN